MKRRLKKAAGLAAHILFLAALFVGSVLFFERTINQAAPDAAQTMSDSTFPVVYMVRGGVRFNCLHGYSRKMDTSRIRDSITPLSSGREIGIAIETFSASIESIAYEVLTLDGMTSLEHTQVIKTEQDDEYVRATLKLQNQMLMNQEYLLRIEVVSGGRPIYYYTHTLLADGLHADDYLNFVTGFYDKTVNGTDLQSIGAAVEPDETTDSEATLAFMDIHDSVDQLTWGGLHPQMFYKGAPKITEINTHTASLTTEYRISAVNEIGVTEVFNVKEFYRVRYTDSRVFLLNFERTTDEVFNPQNEVLEDTGIRLGITGKDVNYKADEKGRIVAFVQENELWTYERASSQLTQIFSFPQKENMDIRDFYDGHRIRILDVASDGDVFFTVTGYMNRGDHEGDNGIALYQYDSATGMLDEKIFLACSRVGQLLQADVDSLSYFSEDHSRLTVLLEEKIYRVDLAARTYEVIAENILDNCHAGSASGRYFAWLESGEEYSSREVTVLDLETLERTSITCEKKDYIRPLCYMNEDLICGTARKKHAKAGTILTGLFPMYKLEIFNPEGEVIKKYRQKGYYVTGVVQSDHMLSLTRVSMDENKNFVPASSDEIVDTDTAGSVAMGTATKKSERKQTQVYLRVGGQIMDKTPEIVRSKVIKYQVPRYIELPAGTRLASRYYVYAFGSLQGVYSGVNEAVAEADSRVGVVIDTDLNYIWVRGDRDNKHEIALEKVPEVMRAGAADVKTLTEGYQGQVLDLTACTLDQVLYFLSHDIPVQVITPDGPLTMVGYDEYNTYLLRPGEDEWFYYGMNDSTEFFASAGNRFYALKE